MSTAPHATQKLMGAMRELLTQSERVARAEARVVASRVGDVAQAGVRRIVLAVAAMMLATLAIGFLLIAAYDALSTHITAWQAALVVSGVSFALTALAAWAASSSPVGTASLLPKLSDRGDA